MDNKIKEVYMGMLKGWKINADAVRSIYAYLLDHKWEVSTFLTPKDKKELSLKDKRRFGMPNDYVVYVDGPQGRGSSMILRVWNVL